MSLIRPRHAARKDLRRGGFVPPLGYQERRRQRTALSLVAGLALAISTMIAVTIVSIGLAQAGVLAATQNGDGSLAVAFVVGGILIRVIAGTFYAKRQESPD
jgi:hypothetical protein